MTIDRHLTRLRARDAIGAEEEAAIRASVSQTLRYPADRLVIRPEEELSHSTLLLDGMMGRVKDLRNGQRQITELHVPGDFVDLHSFTLKSLDHGILTLTPCSVALVPHDRLAGITREHPHLARVFWFTTNVDASIQREWTVSLGRRSAIERMAHLFCELRVRLGLVGLADDSGYALQLTQGELSECLGLTPIHINRVLKQLREADVVEFRGGRVTIRDWAALQRIADFDPAYLYLERRPL